MASIISGKVTYADIDSNIAIQLSQLTTISKHLVQLGNASRNRTL